MAIRSLDAKIIGEAIEQMCNQNNVDVAHMLIECELSRSTVDNMKKGSMPSVDKIYKISEYFHCSIDSIIGRTESTTSYQPNNSGNIVNGDNTNSPLTVGTTEQPDEMQKEISSILSGLTFRERTELMTLIYKFADEHKKY